MTQSTHTSLADRRRLRQLVAALAGAAVISAGGAAAMTPAAQAATADYTNAASVNLRNQYYTGSNDTDITVNDNAAASLYPSPAAISGVQGVITDVDVLIKDITHGFPDDMDVMLVGPNGQRSMLMSDTGGSGDLTHTWITFDDEATTELPTGSQIAEGRYRPTNDGTDQATDPDSFPAPAPSVTGIGTSLSIFDGDSPNGTWQLFVVDDDGGVSGLISGWTIYLTTTDGANPYPATIQVAGATGVVSDIDIALHGFDHTFAPDLDIMVVGPGGQRALIMSDAGGSEGVSGLELMFDDEAGQALPESAKLANGSYRPGNFQQDDPFPTPAPGIAGIGASLSIFDGTNPNGTWQLFIVDDASLDQGGLEGGWGLHITTTDPAPQPTPSTTPTTTPTTTTPSTTLPSDTSHPKVTSTAPKAGAKDVKRGAVVKATLSEKVRRATVTQSSVKLVRKGSSKVVDATLAYNATSRTLSLDPAARLKAGTTYKVVVTSSVEDLAGNALDQKPAMTGLQKAVWTFTTR